MVDPLRCCSAVLLAAIAVAQPVVEAAHNTTNANSHAHGAAAARSHAQAPPADNGNANHHDYTAGYWALFTVLPVALLGVVLLLLLGIGYMRRRSHRSVVYRPRLKQEDVHLQDSEAMEYDPVGVQLHDSMHAPCASVCLEDRDGAPLQLWRAVSLSSIQVQPAFDNELQAFEWAMDLPTSDHPSREARSASF